jgi:hypothetical protein
MVIIAGPKDIKKYSKDEVINTTSSSNNWTRQLSPFFLGPIKLYNGTYSSNLENAWQYSKVYSNFLDDSGNILDKYWIWSKNGWATKFAVRYPMGKGMFPEFSYWDGERLGYIEARKKVYIPLYKEAVIKTEAFKKIQELYKKNGKIILFDFDGYDFIMTKENQDEVINNPHKKMGHAFVLGMLLLAD